MARFLGFMRLRDMYNERVVNVDVATLDTVINEVTAEHQEDVAALEAAWVEVTEVWQTRYNLTVGGTLQPLDENGEPNVGKETGHYDVSVPIKSAGDAWGAGRITMPHMTVAEAARQTARILRNDVDWIRRHIIAAILTKTAYTIVDDLHGSLTINGLANGDTVTYVIDGVVDPATDDHYYAQAAAIADATNPYDDVYNELAEHPSNMVDSANPVVAFISTSLKAGTIDLADFYPIVGGLLRVGANTTVPVDLDMFAPFGSVLGVVDTDGTQTVIVEWKTLPAGYGIVVATGAGQFVYHREYVPTELKGLTAETPAVTGNGLQKRQWIRHAGFAVSNRIAAVAIYCGTSGTWANPTNFTAPLPK